MDSAKMGPLLMCFIALITLVQADSIQYYVSTTCTSQRIGGCDDIGNVCCPAPINTGSYTIIRDEGFGYFEYEDDDCFSFNGNIMFDGCYSISAGQGIGKQPISGLQEFNESTISSTSRISRLNETALTMYPDWPARRIKSKLTIFKETDPVAYDLFIPTDQGQLIQNIANSVDSERRPPGDIVNFGNGNPDNIQYVGRVGDEAGNTRNIGITDAATLGDNVEADYGPTQAIADGDVVTTEFRASLSVNLRQGTLARFGRTFLGNMADIVITYIRAGQNLEAYFFDIGQIENGQFTTIGNMMYQSGPGRELKKEKRGEAFIA